MRNFVIFEGFENLAPLVGRSIDRLLDLAILIDRSIDRSSDRSKERSIDRSTAPATPTTTATTAMTAMTFATTATSMPQASTRTTFYNGGCDAAVRACVCRATRRRPCAWDRAQGQGPQPRQKTVEPASSRGDETKKTFPKEKQRPFANAFRH